MKKKDIWISLAIIAASGLSLMFYMQWKGFVGINSDGAHAELHLRNWSLTSAVITSVKEPAAIKARIYRPQFLSLSIEQNGHKWEITSFGPWGNISTIKVRKNKATALRLGPPFLIKPVITKNGSLLHINFAIIGQAGEQYRNFVTQDNRRVSEAKIIIIDETGNVLESGKFKYG